MIFLGASADQFVACAHAATATKDSQEDEDEKGNEQGHTNMGSDVALRGSSSRSWSSCSGIVQGVFMVFEGSGVWSISCATGVASAGLLQR
jgi:hypothetical protein